jgi:hypothetical protein
MHQNAQTRYICDNCSECFGNKDALRVHMELYHIDHSE